MKLFLKILGASYLLTTIILCAGRCSGNVSAKQAAPRQQQSVTASSVTGDAAVGRAAPIRVVSGDPGMIIIGVAREFDVPSGAIYGIWMKESFGLASGWGSGPGWLSAEDQAGPGSECHAHYGAARCGRWWRALEVVCAQRRHDGSAVCDPRQVRTSYALAMGPTQILPTHLVKESADGSFAWTEYAVDLDGDGAVDPHSLPDALAVTAKLVRKYFDEERDWGRAVNRYYGSQTEGYFEGTSEVRGVADYWRQWCSVPGHCREEGGLLASN